MYQASKLQRCKHINRSWRTNNIALSCRPSWANKIIRQRDNQSKVEQLIPESTQIDIMYYVDHVLGNSIV